MAVGIEGMFHNLGYDSSLFSGGMSELSAQEKMQKLVGDISNADPEDSADEELMSACKSFEAYFLEQVFKEMKKTVHSPEDEGSYMKVFGDNLIQQYAEAATESGQIGLAKQLYDAMSASRNGIQPDVGNAGKTTA